MAVRFDAAADRLLRTSDLLNHNSAYTVMCWVYISVDTNDYANIIGSNDNSVNNADFLTMNANGTQLAVGRTSGGQASFQISSGGTNLTVGTWYHIAMTRSGNVLTAFLNGVQDSQLTATISGRAAATRLEMGGATTSNLSLFNGRVAYARAWSAALIEAEIAAEMDATAAVRTTNLYGDWPIEPGAGVRNQDESGNNRDWTELGTLTDEEGPDVGGVAHEASETDVAGATDTTVASQTSSRAEVDAAGASDSATQSATFARSESDTANATDTSSRTLTAAQSATDSAGATDSSTSAQALERSAADSAGATDDVVLAQEWVRSATDGAGATDSATQAAEAAREQTDSAGASDEGVAEFSGAATRDHEDAAGATDTIVSTQAASRDQIDDAGALDTPSVTQGWNRSVTDAAGATDSVVYELTADNTRSATDDAGATDALTFTITAVRDHEDAAGALDQVLAEAVLVQAQADGATATDSHVQSIVDTSGTPAVIAVIGSYQPTLTVSGSNQPVVSVSGSQDRIVDVTGSRDRTVDVSGSVGT